MDLSEFRCADLGLCECTVAEVVTGENESGEERGSFFLSSIAPIFILSLTCWKENSPSAGTALTT